MRAAATLRAADLAHEMCNLVQVIEGYLELAAKRSDDETLQRYLANARAAADQMAALCRDFPDEPRRTSG